MSFAEEILRRLELLRTDALPRPIDDSWTRTDLFAALEKAAGCPPIQIVCGQRQQRIHGGAPAPPRDLVLYRGLRVFGWTTAYRCRGHSRRSTKFRSPDRRRRCHDE
jgi:hypothetical protein